MNDVTTIPRKSPSRSDHRRRLFRERPYVLAAVIVSAAAVVLVGWLVASRVGGTSEPGVGGAAVEPVEPVALSAPGLKTLASAVGQPVYWAGPRQGFQYELRRTEDGNTYIRYLPPGAEVGAGGADYLTVATYPFPDALAALEKVAADRGIELAGGGLALVAADHPTSVHLAYPGVDYQVEVYDPSSEKALEVARSGDVRPAG